jgi:LPS sulfotransferase NodH
MWDHATTPNGVLGSKPMFNDFDWLRSSLRPPAGTDAGLEFMRTTFPHPQFVWLRRADKVRQGILRKMAMRCTGLRAVRAMVICVTCELWPGVRRAGLGKG